MNKKCIKDIELFIFRVKSIDETMAFICTNGACFNFAVYVQLYFPASELYISDNRQHVIVKCKNKFYDINGERSGEGYKPMTFEDEVECSSWSFKKNYYTGEKCKNRGEIVY